MPGSRPPTKTSPSKCSVEGGRLQRDPLREGQRHQPAKGGPSCRPCSTSCSQATPLVVTRDRPAGPLHRRPAGHRQELKAKGVALKATEQPIDTAPQPARRSSTCWGSLPSSRPTCAASGRWKGSPRPRLRGVYKGRKPSIDADRVRELQAAGKGATEIARELGIGRASVYQPTPLTGGVRGPIGCPLGLSSRIGCTVGLSSGPRPNTPRSRTMGTGLPVSPIPATVGLSNAIGATEGLPNSPARKSDTPYSRTTKQFGADFP